MARKPFSDKLIKQARYLLLNKELALVDIERILRYQISWTSISLIHKKRIYSHIEGYELPDDYDEYMRVYVKSTV